MTPAHRIATHEEWKAKRDELLKEEQELTRHGNELARKRHELPRVAIETDYRFARSPTRSLPRSHA